MSAVSRAMLADLAADPEALAELRRLVGKEVAGRLLTAGEVAELVRVDARTVNTWAREGRIDAVRVGRGWRFTREAVEALPERPAAPETPGAAPMRRPRRRSHRSGGSEVARMLREM